MKNSIVEPNYQEVDFIEISLLVLKEKKKLLISIIFGAILAALITKFIIKPIFISEFIYKVDIPEKVSTEYGSVNFQGTANLDYGSIIKFNEVLEVSYSRLKNKDISYNKFKKSIDFSKKSSPIFLISVEGFSPENAQEKAEILYDEYLNRIEYLSKKRFNLFFINNYDNAIKNNKKDLEFYENQLEHFNLISEKNLSEEGDNEIGNAVNSFQINQERFRIIKELDNLKLNMGKNQERYNELKSIEKDLNEYETNHDSKTLNKSYSALKNHVVLLQAPTLPKEKSSPSMTMNVFIGTMTSFFIMFIYLFVKKTNKNI